MKKILTISIVLCVQLAFAQNELNEIEIKLQALAEENAMRLLQDIGCCIGENCDELLRDSIAEKLKEEFSLTALKIIVDHENPMFRAYAFQALAEQKYEHLEDIFYEHLSDTEFIKENKYKIYPFRNEAVISFMFSKMLEHKYEFKKMSEESYRREIRKNLYHIEEIVIDIDPEDLN